MTRNDVVIVAAKRTPIGALQGCFADVKATELGAHAIKSCLKAGGLPLDKIDELYMGCVLPAGLGQAPARQAALNSGLSMSTPCTTVNKVCGSGMKAITLGCDQIRLGNAEVVISGGMESMTNAPYLLLKARSGYRLGHNQIVDHMFYDGLEDAYKSGRLMGTFAEDTADRYGFTREMQDDFTRNSTQKALQAMQSNAFAHELAPVTIKGRKGEEVINVDETPTKVNIDKIPQLKPAFREGGTVTAANSSSISDGAAAVLLMNRDTAQQYGHQALAVVKGHATFAQEPEWFTTAPVGAINKLCQQLDWDVNDVDLFEINEAFAVVTMAAIHDLKIPVEKVNVHGGACALGHPIGASGARLVVTLVHALHLHDKKRGIAAICLGGGEAIAIAVERE